MAKYEYKVKGVDYVVEIQDIEGMELFTTG